MRFGKVKESILKRSVLRQLHRHTPFGSPQYGEDAGLFPADDSQLLRANVLAEPVSSGEDRKRDSLCPGKSGSGDRIAVSVNPVEGWTLAARRTVYTAVNSLAAAGAVPAGISLSILMPKETEEPALKKLMREIDALCGEEGICCLSGHTAVSPYVTDLVISVTALGYQNVKGGKASATRETDRVDSGGKQPLALRPGMDIIVAGTVGREGAAILAHRREKELLTRYPAFFVEEAKSLFDDGSMAAAAAAARQAGTAYIHDVREGGIFAALWELAAAGKVGIDTELKRIPIRQHTIEVCEFFRLNPYMLRSGGTLLLACDNGERVTAALAGAGILAAVIGRTTDNNDKIIRYDDEIRYLEPPKEDELYHII
ncbi:MAG TPA: hydrogenase maturation factor [Candidatus Anaerobutyricum stercoripullorum]|uniref:Hydrogenase maturation factor n=1 Tax=Candidatus Anaerobutyricum stercoripullorum TaxID=2838456 RepID=A0A9D1X4U4_9FIRM|nr:hydrogenase maturation factor [Candidatus Anaerobutyricum stercoripullorum]